ncbi:MAG: MFS transporter [Xanthomonadales bacterium]|nr:MFS transporter [Xanthomonadales bacterium]
MNALPATVWRLMVANAMMMSGISLMVLIAGIIGVEFAPTEGLATLPVACLIVGVASATLPTGRLLQRFGRRRVFMGYGGLAMMSAALAAWSLQRWYFGFFCLAAFLMGWSGAAGHQYRFAALEAVSPDQAPRATALLLMGGIMAAIVGPELAVRGRDLLQEPFTGSFVLLVLAYGLGVIVIGRNQDAPVDAPVTAAPMRSLGEILSAPVAVLAIAAASLAYGVMSFLMTATPISMHSHDGLSLEATKWVIQSHIVAMYLPSLFFAALLARLGYRGMLICGALAYFTCVVTALSGNSEWHYWLALVLLGLGWNMLFLTATNLLPRSYRPEERYRAQSANDFLVFSVQATVALGSGWFLFHWRWAGMLVAVLPMVVAFLVLVLRSPALAAGRGVSGPGPAPE